MEGHGGGSIASRRLCAQHLVGEPFPDPAAAVRRFGAIQSQDLRGAKWAVGQRSASTESALERLLDEGSILRTHVLRPTWHFLAPEDAAWMLELSAPHIRASLTARHRELELDERTASRASAAFGEALQGGRHLVRAEMAEVLLAQGISPAGQRLAHLLMGAELDRVIISGRRRGKQPSYALFEERVRKAVAFDREAALSTLALRYFESHGPAQLADFAWWSGLRVVDARAGIAGAGVALQSEVLQGIRYWSVGDVGCQEDSAGRAHFLPNYDEYLVAFRHRAAALDPDLRFDPDVFAFGSVLSNVLTIGGRVRGSWRRLDRSGETRLRLRLLAALSDAEWDAVEAAALGMSRFLERPVALDHDS